MKDDMNVVEEDDTCNFIPPTGFYNRKNPPQKSMLSQYIKEWGLNRSAIESMNSLYINDLPEAINGTVINDKHTGGKLVVHNVRLTKPTLEIFDGVNSPLYPSEALLRNLHYKSKIIVDVTFYPQENITTQPPPVNQTIINNENKGGGGALLYKKKTQTHTQTQTQTQTQSKPTNVDNSFNKFSEMTKTVSLMSIPVMTNSILCNLSELSPEERIQQKCCPYDVEGYFITSGQDKGGEKTILPQERMGGNIIMCFKKKDYSVEIRCSSFNIKPKKTSLSYINKGVINSYFCLTIEKNFEFNIAVILRIFNFRYMSLIEDILYSLIIRNKEYSFEDKKRIQIMLHNLVYPHIQFEQLLFEQDRIDEYLIKSMDIDGFIDETTKKNIHDKISSEILIHVKPVKDTDNINEMKCHLILLMWSKLCEMIIELPNVGGQMSPLRDSDDRDNYANKRIDMPGTLLSVVIHQFYGRFVDELQKYMDKDLTNIHPIDKFIKQKTKPVERFMNNLDTCMNTGNWGEKGNQQNKVGVSQPLSRQSLIGAQSHVRRINTSIDKTGKNTMPRLVHSTQWGFVDPLETPEGKPCGLVKNPTLLLYTSLYNSPNVLLEYIKEDILPFEVFLNTEKPDDIMPVICNGNFIGWCHGWYLRSKLVSLRRQKFINFSISISINWDYELIINTEAGRCLRPLFIVNEEDGRLELEHHDFKIDYETGCIERLDDATLSASSPIEIFKELEDLGCIEYLDGYEIDGLIGPNNKVNILALFSKQLLKDSETASRLNLPTAKDYSFTYLEIDPNCIFGLCVALIPFPDSNQSPRNAYWAAMGKQAVGITSLFFNERFETNSKLLLTPQKSLVTTETLRTLELDQIPATIIPIVQVNTAEGYNIEDSIVISQSSLDFGLGRTINYHSITVHENPSKHKVFGIPKLRDGDNPNKFSHLDYNGFPNIGTKVEAGQPLVGMVQLQSNGEVSDVSYYLKGKDFGIVDSVCITSGPKNIKYCKIRLRETRIPQVGDKFASLHAQKGTIGRVVPRVDLPFSSEGITPDIIINPHAFPSRMTIGMLKEMIVFLVCVLTGCIADATAFKHHFYFDNNVLNFETEGNGDGDNDDDDSVLSSQTNVCDILHQLQFRSDGKQTFYCGITGEMLFCPLFMGPTGYNILKHYVGDKMHSRARGPRQNVNRQPLEGRSRNGGLRLGEMERDNFIAYGSASFLRERFMTVSDNFEMDVCGHCGFPMITNYKNNIYKCTNCNTSSPVSVTIPHSSKLLLNNLNCMGTSTRFIT
jgi:DNA-directed RNA polymerase II subunit RPB2